MITIIAGTNRNNSFSSSIAHYYQQLLADRNTGSRILDLRELPPDFTFTALYGNSGKNELFNQFQRVIDENDKLIFVVPEYNGSYPGVLKAFVDGLRYPSSLQNKKIALVGVSSGVEGAAVALSHFADVLSYLGAHILGLRIKMGQIQKYMVNGEITHPRYLEMIHQQLDQFMAF
jgi:chromate reductase, NAD(P)H dehydrogenase (quinone)